MRCCSLLQQAAALLCRVSVSAATSCFLPFQSVHVASDARMAKEHCVQGTIDQSFDLNPQEDCRMMNSPLSIAYGTSVFTGTHTPGMLCSIKERKECEKASSIPGSVFWSTVVERQVSAAIWVIWLAICLKCEFVHSCCRAF